MSGLLVLHAVSVVFALAMWRRVGREAAAEGIHPVAARGWLVVFGLAGAYGFSLHREARIRDMRGPLGWGTAGLAAVLSAEALPFAASLPGAAAGIALWILVHVAFLRSRPGVTVDSVLERAGRRGRREKDEGRLLVVSGLAKHFPVRRGLLQRRVGSVKAVDGVDLEVRPGETLALVGESGSGKTTTGRLILRLLEPTRGAIRYRGVELSTLTATEMRALRREIQIIFQDPYSSLNPRMTVEAMLAEALAIHGIARGKDASRRVEELLGMVGLSAYHARRYPHEFSGGQRQRIGIARALAVEPRLIVCDEPVSALDVSVQAQIVNLLKELQERLHLTYIFIAHDLNVVAHLSDRVAVMYLGRIVEVADRDTLVSDPRHPYTRSLLAAVPVADPGARRDRPVLVGDVPSPLAPPTGCPFHPRCPEAGQECRSREQELTPLGPERLVACHRASELAPWRPASSGI